MGRRKGQGQIRLRVNQFECSVGACGNQAKCSSPHGPLCSVHYQRWDTRGTLDTRKEHAICTVEGCDRQPRSRTSPLCEMHYYRERRAATKKPQRHCLQCGAHIGPWGRFCSQRCRTRNWRGVADEKICQLCLEPFPHPGTNSPYCSTECAREAQYFQEHTRRVRVLYSPIEKFSRIEIFKRDNWRCQLCGKKVRRRAPSRHPDSPSIDHIVPVAKGGTHSRANVQTVHLKCNFRKQAKSMGQLRLFG